MKNAIRTAPDRKSQLDWIERVAAYVAADGTPPIAGRILGWLMICNPPEQSAADIAKAISASRASMTTNLQILTATGLVERRARSGQRTEFYRVLDDAWERLVRRQVAGLTAFRQVARDGLALTGSNRTHSARVREADQIFTWLTNVFERAPPMPSGKRVRLDRAD